MWPILVGIGIAALLAKAFSDGNESPKRKSSNRKKSKKKIFISFAIEDKKYRDFLVAQAKNERSPFSFVDMSSKLLDDATRKYIEVEIPNLNNAMAIFSDSVIEKVNTLLFESFNTKRIPIKIFQKEDKAREWLKQYL